MSAKIYSYLVNPVHNALSLATVTAQYLSTKRLPFWVKTHRFLGYYQVVSMLFDICVLCDQVEKYHAEKKNKKSYSRNVKLLVAAGFALAIGSIVVAILGIQRFRPPHVNPTDLVVKGLNLSAEEAKNLHISWQVPGLDRISLAFRLFRFGLSFGILTFTKDKTVALVNSSLQALTLFQMAGVPWVKMDLLPDMRNVKVQDIKDVSISFYAILPRKSGCPVPQSHLQNSLQDIYGMAKKIFQGSLPWKFTTVNVTKNGAPAGTFYRYDVQVKEQVYSLCDCKQNFYLETITGWAYNTFYKVHAVIKVIL